MVKLMDGLGTSSFGTHVDIELYGFRGISFTYDPMEE
jgi:hypothetical protein